MAKPGRARRKASCSSSFSTAARSCTAPANRRGAIDQIRQFDDVLPPRVHMRCAFHPDGSRTPPLGAMQPPSTSVGRVEQMECSMHDVRAIMKARVARLREGESL
jgi:hypothetical protein